MPDKEIRHHKDQENKEVNWDAQQSRHLMRAVSKHLSSQDRKPLIQDLWRRMPKNNKTFKNRMRASRVLPMKNNSNKAVK